MTTNKSVRRSNAPQETASNCGYAGLQAIVSAVRLFANKYIALNHLQTPDLTTASLKKLGPVRPPLSPP